MAGIHSSHTNYNYNYTVNEDKTEERKKILDVASKKEKNDQLIQTLDKLLNHQQEMEKGLSDQQMEKVHAFLETRYEQYRTRQLEELDTSPFRGGLLDKLFRTQQEATDPAKLALDDLQDYIENIRGSDKKDMERRRDQIASTIDNISSAIANNEMTQEQMQVLHDVLQGGSLSQIERDYYERSL